MFCHPLGTSIFFPNEVQLLTCFCILQVLNRAKKVEEIKEAFTADVNKKREQIEQGFKDKEEALMEQYKEDTTEGFV